MSPLHPSPSLTSHVPSSPHTTTAPFSLPHITTAPFSLPHITTVPFSLPHITCAFPSHHNCTLLPPSHHVYLPPLTPQLHSYPSLTSHVPFSLPSHHTCTWMSYTNLSKYQCIKHCTDCTYLGRIILWLHVTVDLSWSVCSGFAPMHVCTSISYLLCIHPSPYLMYVFLSSYFDVYMCVFILLGLSPVLFPTGVCAVGLSQHHWWWA